MMDDDEVNIARIEKAPDEEGRPLMQLVLQQVRLQREEMRNLQNEMRHIRGERIDRQRSQSIRSQSFRQYDLDKYDLGQDTKDDVSIADLSSIGADVSVPTPVPIKNTIGQDRVMHELQSMKDRMKQLETQKNQFEDNPVHVPVDVEQNIENENRISQMATNGSYVTKILTRNLMNHERLPDDTFTLMMLSRPCSASWAVGITFFSVQITLYILIMLGFENDGHFFGVPWRQDAKNYVGQFLSLFFAVLAQNDILSSIQVFIWCRRSTRWDVIILGKEMFPSASTWEWLLHIAIPNTMKLLQGIFALFVYFMIIIQSDSIINVFKNFAALTVVNELNNIAFDLAANGYFGRSLQSKAAAASDIEIDVFGLSRGSAFTVRIVTLCILILSMVAGWAVIVYSQIHGDFFRTNFPECNEMFEIAEKYFGDGRCYGGPLNTIECGFEDGDCIDFNMAYPNCKGNSLTNVQNEVGNGICNMMFASSECDYDGGDCCPYSIFHGSSSNHRLCTGGLASTQGCGYDNGDCLSFLGEFPDCPLEKLALLNGSNDVILGDGVCDSPIYNISECGYENGDCALL